MDYEIHGDFAQYARLSFQAGESCWAGKGSIMSYTPGIEWSLEVPGGAAGAVRRVLSGEGLALARLTASGRGGVASLCSNLPGRIFAWNLQSGPVMTTRGAFLGAWGDIDISVTVARRAGAALFGGAGLFLQRISGRGIVLVHASGDVDDRDLSSGESLIISTGNIAAFADSIDYDVRSVGGLGKMVFGAEGIFMTHLTGPGRVLLQTLKRGAMQKGNK